MKPAAQYLLRYAVPEARAFYELAQNQYTHSELGTWRNVLVIPAYKESPSLLQNLQRYSNTLLILVLNRPDTEKDLHCNDELRDYIQTLKEESRPSKTNSTLRCVDAKQNNHVLLIERAEPLPRKEGVGLARKLGCDVALALAATDVVTSPWIHCTDADAVLPSDYFSAAASSDAAVALIYPFAHMTPADCGQAQATKFYEAYLNHYVEGLRSAGSPYGFHTIGSCIAIKAETYAVVRGFPRRAAGEDFYLLNKAVKEGQVRTPDCEPILLSARLSSRVPFGTGPALQQLLDGDSLESVPYFYDPRCFEGLTALIGYAKEQGVPGSKVGDFGTGLRDHPETLAAVIELGLERFLDHAKKQCATKGAFILQFHQWLDGFRTLKLIHALSVHWPKLTAAESAQRRTSHQSAP
ncbi:hypothetical protein [Congregibacter sp.]|uniref:hypothetical protein n=1 Tax=Congregibacter sp. TaxID=2744308 RepID=UPI003859562A